MLILFVFGGLLFVGICFDQRSIPPDFGSYCKNADVEAREQTPSASLPEPPPGVAIIVDGEAASEPGLALFELDQLSPRAGIGLNGTRNAEIWSRHLGFGWYVDWTVQSRYPTQQPEHWQMVRLGRGCIYPSPDGIRWLAARYPGNVWVIGNEPDNIWQDNISPEEYAQVYHKLYALIKEADPTAAVAVGGVTQGTSLRLAYLDRVLATYEALYGNPLPADWWTVHGYVLNEDRFGWGAGIPVGLPGINNGVSYAPDDAGDLTYFKQHILDFRAWMAERGYRDRPLAITEIGLAISNDGQNTPEVVARFLVATFTWLGAADDEKIGYPADDNHLVQRWAWYSLYTRHYSESNLANLETDELTIIGKAFREYNLSQAPY